MKNLSLRMFGAVNISFHLQQKVHFSWQMPARVHLSSGSVLFARPMRAPAKLNNIAQRPRDEEDDRTHNRHEKRPICRKRNATFPFATKTTD